MKAVQVTRSGEEVKLSLAEVDEPAAGPGQILVAVHAAGVTPSELTWYPTTHTPSGEARRHAIPGHEFSGVITRLGQGVSGFTVGEPVYGMNDWFQDGATAEYCLTTPWSIATKPDRLTHVEAATVPIGALTAWQGLFEKAHLRAGERVLVQGGSGAVGLFAVQLARLHGVQVIATASTDKLSFVRDLGAQQVIDYRTAHFEDAAGRVDVVFDTVGGKIRDRSRTLLAQNGRLVSIAEDETVTTDPKSRDAFFIVEPNRTQLAEITRMLDDGRLRAFVKGVVSLEQAAQAYTGVVGPNTGFGKLVVSLK